MEKMRQWSILTAVAVLALLVGGWFLLVSPQRSHAASLRSQTADQQSTNASLQSQINQLQQQKQGLPAQQKLLQQIADKVPNNPELPTLIRQLSAAANGAGVDLVSMAPSPPTLVTTAPTAGVGTTSSSSSSSSSTSASAPVATLAQIPVTLTVRGSYYNIDNFFRAVENLSRATLVTTWQMSLSNGGAASAGATSGAAALPPNTLTATLTGEVFMSPDVTAPAAGAATTSTSAPATSSSSAAVPAPAQ